MSQLDISKIYIDTRFRASGDETDFTVELPRVFNVPPNTTCWIDDIVIPVSWSSIDSRNNMCYVRFNCGNFQRDTEFAFTPGNYTGAEFQSALSVKLNQSSKTFVAELIFTCVYDLNENILKITITDPRSSSEKSTNPCFFEILNDQRVKDHKKIHSPNTINNIIRNTTTKILTDAGVYSCYIDLYGTRNLYLTSSALSSYDTVSNFGNDTIVKKIPCGANYNQLIVLNSGSVIDGMDVSKRTLRILDFKLVDTNFKTIPLRGNHFSFSIIFKKR